MYGEGPPHDIIASSPRSESGLSTSSTDSMVQITRTPIAEPPNPTDAQEESKHRLLYSKSKVYVHPTAWARDNIPGFVGLVKRESIAPTYLLFWIPESLLDEKGRTEWEKFVKVENSGSTGHMVDEDDDDVVLIDAPPPRGESYAFSVPLTSIYSLSVYPPTLSSWYGSITIHLVSGTTLPTIHFHDDESHSLASISSSPGSARIPGHAPTWGGEDLLQRLRSYCNLLRSTLQPTLFLVDPNKADIEVHTTPIFSDSAVDQILSHQSYSSPIPPHLRPHGPPSPSGSSFNNNGSNRRSEPSLLHETLPSSSLAHRALLTSFSHITRATRQYAQNILSHPSARPIIPYLPDPVKSLVNVQGEWTSWVEKGGVGEFESARVYLARWARIVAEEGERARQREAHVVKATASSTGEENESSDLGVFELLASISNLPTPKPTRDPRHPIDNQLWESWFNEDGKPKIEWEEFRQTVFRKGLTHEVRKKAWPFILGVLPWDATTDERQTVWEQKRSRYAELKAEWADKPEVFDREDIVEERHRIDVDCRRTDRTQPLFSNDTNTPPATPSASGHTKKGSAFSPQKEEIGSQPQSNDHVERLASVLLTYGFFEKDLGYVQGMSDLCAPVYIINGADEAMTFWCFVSVMDRMKQNFLRDQSGMKKKLLALQQLIAVMDPELYRHFEKTEALNLFFCFRWVLIAFKREFPFEDVLRLWEVLWTDYYSNEFVLFIALAILESHRDVILRYLVEFDEILKYCNELSMTIELDSTLAQAEVLFLSFSQIVADIDKRRIEQQKALTSPEGLRKRAGGKDKDRNNAANLNLPIISETLRELLISGR